MITVRKLNQNCKAVHTNANAVIGQCRVDSQKLGIMHVVSSTQTVSLAPLTGNRKLSVLKNITPCDEFIIKEIKTEPTSPKKPEVYHQRKSMLLEYKELFAALMRLPDRELQKKLLDVINNHRSVEHRTVEAQTDPVEIKPFTTDQQCLKPDNVSIETIAPSNGSHISSSGIKRLSIPQDIAKKKKRKRKVSIPQANKESRTKLLSKIHEANPNNRSNSSTTTDKIQFKINSPKRQRIHSFCISECSSDVVNIYEDTETNHLREIEQCGLPLENGLLPIQDAVVRNQINKLNLHIFIWNTYKRIDLNDILTEDDEDLLQLAILNTCDPSIVSILLKKGLNPNILDADSNTIVHLAVLNDITEASLDHLMRYIDIKLLLTLNDDGYPPLHLAIRQDRYLLAERLINILDERLVKKVFYKRPMDELETDEVILKRQFKDYYEKVCLQMAVDDETDLCVVDNHDLKQKLLQAGDRRSGNTSLYFAIDNRFEHLIYFLLAHLTDPRTENLSGVDCKTFFCEFGKSLNLSLNIDNTMEKVIKILS